MPLVRRHLARPIKPNRRSVTGRFPVSDASVPFESALERDFLVVLAFEDQVAEVLSQPVRIDFLDGAGNPRHYTPDYRVRYSDPSVIPALVEVKYRADLKADWANLKPRFKAAIRYARQRGMKFRIQTEVEIRGRADVASLRFLLPYRRQAEMPDIERALLSCLARLRAATVDDLLTAAVPAQARLAAQAALWRLVAIRRIHADLTRPINMASLVTTAEIFR